MLFGNTPIRADGKGFVIARDIRMQLEIAFVDWEGKSHEVALDAAASDNDEKKIMLYFPSVFLSRWDTDTAEVSYKQWRIRLDTKMLKGSLEERPATEYRVGKESLQQKHEFPDGVKVRALIVENAEGNFDKSRLEILTPGANKPRVVVERDKGSFAFSASPDKNLLAVWCMDDGTGTPRVYVVNSKGEVVSEAGVGQSK